MSTEHDCVFSGNDKIIPFAHVQHLEWVRGSKDGPHPGEVYGATVVMKTTRWNFEQDTWDNSVWLDLDNAMRFVGEWTAFLERRSR